MLNFSDDEDITFYPMNSKKLAKHELSDTFSLQEMTIVDGSGNTDDNDDDDDDDDSESQNLEFLSPKLNYSCLDRIVAIFCCVNTSKYN